MWRKLTPPQESSLVSRPAIRGRRGTVRGAPDFVFYDFPRFVRVEDGAVVEANQVSTS